MSKQARNPLVIFVLLVLIGAGSDAFGQVLSASLSASDHNGFNISCFGVKDGTLDVTATGGTPPYTYDWSNGASTAAISELAAGYYKVKVGDAVSATVEVDITLVEPLALKVEAEPFKYPSGLNISCFNCFNGSINVTVEYGVPPYSYDWGDDVSTQDRMNLGSANFIVKVTDVNGCSASSESMFLQEPERSDWTMNGNANTNPAVQYIGTSDNKAVVFKANGQEALRLGGNGDISLMGSLVGEGLLMRGPDGKIRLAGDEFLIPLPTTDCWTRGAQPYWNTTGNAFAQICPDFIPRLGTTTAVPLKIITNNVQRMVVTTDGKVVVGPGAAHNIMNVASTNQRTGIDIENSSVGVTSSASCEVRFMKNGSQRWGLGTDLAMNGGQDFYLWDHTVAPEVEGGSPGKVRLLVDSEGRVVIGDVARPAGYRLFVEEGILTDRLKVALHTGLDWSDHVFAADYCLMPLAEVGKYIDENGHLPGVPSAAEMVKTGLDVAKTDAMLMEKVEELTLYIVDLNRRIMALESKQQD